MTKLKKLEIENQILRERLTRINSIVYAPNRYDDVCSTYGMIQYLSSSKEINEIIKQNIEN